MQQAAKSMHRASDYRVTFAPKQQILVDELYDYLSSYLPPGEAERVAKTTINTIATWLEHRSKGHLGTGTHWAAVLKSEANR
jgi:hypothetical protein